MPSIERTVAGLLEELIEGEGKLPFLAAGSDVDVGSTLSLKGVHGQQSRSVLRDLGKAMRDRGMRDSAVRERIRTVQRILIGQYDSGIRETMFGINALGPPRVLAQSFPDIVETEGPRIGAPRPRGWPHGPYLTRAQLGQQERISKMRTLFTRMFDPALMENQKTFEALHPAIKSRRMDEALAKGRKMLGKELVGLRAERGRRVPILRDIMKAGRAGRFGALGSVMLLMSLLHALSRGEYEDAA